MEKRGGSGWRDEDEGEWERREGGRKEFHSFQSFIFFLRNFIDSFIMNE